MKTIGKYALLGAQIERVNVPRGARVLTVQMQGAQVCLWALADSREPLVTMTVWVFGTGFEMPEEVGRYLSTVQTRDGFVWHYFLAPGQADIEQ